MQADDLSVYLFRPSRSHHARKKNHIVHGIMQTPVTLTWFPCTLTVGLFISQAALIDSTGSSSSNSPPAYSSGSSWSSIVSPDDALRTETCECQFLVVDNYNNKPEIFSSCCFVNLFVHPGRSPPSVFLVRFSITGLLKHERNGVVQCLGFDRLLTLTQVCDLAPFACVLLVVSFWRPC